MQDVFQMLQSPKRTHSASRYDALIYFKKVQANLLETLL